MKRTNCNKKLSIIFIVYNLEDYVVHGLHSILPQLTRETELLVVNDGSTDHSAEIIEKTLAGNPYAQLLSKENGGLSSARNYGLTHAQSEYIWFVDGDDEIASDAIKVFLEGYDRLKNSQVIFFGTQHKRLNETKLRIEKELINLVDVDVYTFFDEVNMIPVPAWCFFFKRSFLLKNNLYYKEGIVFEDNEFSLRLYNKVVRISAIDRALYIYKARAGSITKSEMDDHKINSILTTIISWQQLKPNQLTPQTISEQIYWVIGRYLKAIKNTPKEKQYHNKLKSTVKRQRIFLKDPIGIIKNKLIYNLFKVYV